MSRFMVQIGRVSRCATSALFGIASLTICTAGQNKTAQTVILRVEPTDRKVLSSVVEIRTEGKRLNVLSVSDPSTMPLNVAFVIDAGPDQSRVLNKEKDIALAILNAFPAPTSKLLVVRAGYQHTLYPATRDRAEATHLVESLATEEGKKSEIPIYDTMAAAVGELSQLPGVRGLILIAEGNDYGSNVGYKGLRDLMRSHSVSCLVVLVDDHPTRGTKSILRYGWSLQDLANDTAGAFIENSRKVPRTVTRLAEMIASFRLVTFDTTGLSPGRHRVAVTSLSGLRLHSQKAIFLGTAVLGPETE